MADVVVLGAGPTGLATAMLLAHQGLDTVVLERDEAPPNDPDRAWENWERRSVTQFRQAHLLLAGGAALLKEHLPGVVAQLQEVGAVRLNIDQRLARLLPNGAAGVDLDRFETLTCRRPLIDYAFAAAARATPRLDVRYGCAAAELLTGTEAIKDVPHIVGVRTNFGQTVSARLVIDAAGRRTRLPAMLQAAGGRRPEEHGIEIGFAYHTRFYQAPELPEIRDDLNSPVGSFNILTVPADHDYWSVTIYHSSADKEMRRCRNPQVFERVVRSLPHHAHWLDGKPQGPILSMASSTNTTREFIFDLRPCATGVLPVGDAWGYTNPSIGRGITLGLMHGVDVAPILAAHLDDPIRLATGWTHATEGRAVPWHTSTVDVDRIRGLEVEAFRRREPDPFDRADPAVARARAFANASHYDSQVFQWFAEVRNCTTLPAEVLSRDGASERVLEVASSNPPHATPGPDRAELEALLV